MQAIEFNFVTKRERTVSLDELSAQAGEGVFYWVTFRPEEKEEARRVLERLGANPEAAVELVGPQKEARYDLYEDAVHFSVAEAWFEEGVLKSGIIEFLLGRHYLAVMQMDQSQVMSQIRRIYREDFQKFARTPGFLTYELASVLLDYYRRAYQSMTNAVEQVQLTLFGKVTDDIFLQVSNLTADILSFRRMVLASRDLFNELATRRSAFINESTQPALKLIADRMERLGDDIDSERSVLAETLNLYMGMVSHRTNRVVNRLTILSMLFLPLSFLCGVYGMNFEVMPETRWPYAYAIFWGVCILFVATFLIVIKRQKWI